MPETKKKISKKKKLPSSKSKNFGGLDSFISGKQKKTAKKTKTSSLKKTKKKIPIKEEKEKKNESRNKISEKRDVNFKGSLTPSKKTKKKTKPIEKKQELDKGNLESEKIDKENGKSLEKKYFQKNSDPIGDAQFTFLKRESREQQKSWHLRFLSKEKDIIQDMEKGILLTVDYDGGFNKAFAKFFDLSDNSIKIWIDTTNHEPYCYHTDEKADIENALSGFEGFTKIEEVKKFDLLEDKLIDIRKIYGITPTDIGGAKGIREELGGAWEARIRYHHNFIYDRNLIPGMLYKIDKGKIIPINPQIDEKIELELLKVFQNAPTEMKEMAKLYQPIFSSPTPSLLRMAYDIEVEESPDGGLPNPMLAREKVISISFAATDGLKKVYCLDRDDLKPGTIPENFPKNAEYFFFKNERELIKESFRLFWKYPIIITFNGDNFDNTYLFHRARKLKIKDEENPIYLSRGGGMVTHNTDFKHAIHIDIFQFFANRSIKGYAFGGAYVRNSLEEVSSSLLGSGKIKHEGIMIGEMTLANLIHYNLVDSIRTLELTTFNNGLVWNLIFVLMRITKLPLQDIFRLQISAWIRSLLYYEHRRKNYLIPRMSDLEQRGHFSRTNTSKFQGAYVIDPIPGIHFKVAVLDFSSLYPSVIKTRNLSYETVNCIHPTCEDNMLENTSYWACTKKIGIFAYVVGYLRDIRVKWYKPMSSDKSLSVQKREAAKVMTSALKVFINGCLPYDEEVIIRNKKNQILRKKIGDLSEIWHDIEILSIINEKSKFGKKIFVPIKDFTKKTANSILEITLSDGRNIRCTPEHIIPKVDYEQNFAEIEADKLKIGDNILVHHRNPLNEEQNNSIFIPDIIENEELWIGLEREEYKKHTYRKNQNTENKIISIINSKFKYSKVSKKYKFPWKKLTLDEKESIKEASEKKYIPFLIKYGEEAGKWNNIIFDLQPEFFELLGWYIAEGNSDKNRIVITQSKKLHLANWNKIINIIESLGYPYSQDNKKRIRINSNIIKEIIVTLCSKGAEKKRIPLEILNIERAKLLLESYFNGDGNLTTKKRRRYSTISTQLKNDLVYILGALGKYVSIHLPSNNDNIFRIIETKGKKYKRKNYGLLDFNGTTPVKIKNITKLDGQFDVFDIETGNGWFVTTNGIVVHNCYGVFGSTAFPLYFRPVAEATTAISRFSIQQTIDKAKSMKVDVLYGDTDSVFLLDPSKKQIEELIQWSTNELDLDLELEKTYQFLALSSRKKNYIGVRMGGQQVDLKGLMAKKGNTPNFIKIRFKEVQKILTKIVDMESFNDNRKKIIKIIKRTNSLIGKSEEKGGFKIEDYGITIVLKRKLADYTKSIPQHVRVANMMTEAEKKDLGPGSFITFIKTRTQEKVKPINQAKINDIDYKKYKELVRSAFEQVLDALDISYEEILGTIKLSSFF
ncbi:DNA polymerase domain-containing protein [Promethearchaeum syntrophicum]|uniref:DNA polymerase n=1 Tax=Promethearchaeum syntrophicum TaxID=2594042 RepID=A0A5B9DGB5_9ARCH|nr:DNA polymerase domain-containing protein [Candidatus Prometheoarchaeum syntrophicum]QEE18071.1 DNA polymerase 1 [Candidatus Prometheoarchaeum syntrophicum]